MEGLQELEQMQFLLYQNGNDLEIKHTKMYEEFGQFDTDLQEEQMEHLYNLEIL